MDEQDTSTREEQSEEELERLALQLLEGPIWSNEYCPVSFDGEAPAL